MYFAITPSPFRFNAVVVVDAVFIVVGVVGLFTGNYRCSSLEFSEWQQTRTSFSFPLTELQWERANAVLLC